MEKSNSKVIIFAFIFLALINISLSSAITASIGNAKMIVYPDFNNGETEIQKYILVKNVNNETVNITLEVSNELKDIIELNEKNFILEAGKDKKVNFLIKLTENKNIDGKINVFFSPLDSKNGVVLSSSISIRPNGADDEDENSDDEETNQDDNLTGNAVFENINTGLVIGFATTIILAIILIVLVIIAKNKKNKGVKINSKRSDRSS